MITPIHAELLAEEYVSKRFAHDMESMKKTLLLVLCVMIAQVILLTTIWSFTYEDREVYRIARDDENNYIEGTDWNFNSTVEYVGPKDYIGYLEIAILIAPIFAVGHYRDEKLVTTLFGYSFLAFIAHVVAGNLASNFDLPSYPDGLFYPVSIALCGAASLIASIFLMRRYESAQTKLKTLTASSLVSTMSEELIRARYEDYTKVLKKHFLLMTPGKYLEDISELRAGRTPSLQRRLMSEERAAYGL